MDFFISSLMSMQENIDFFKAWEIWVSGESISNYYISGIKIIWIGRFGKFIAFISALTIIIDIIGVEKAREFGEYAKNLISARYFIRVVPDYIRPRYRRLISWLRNDLYTLRKFSIWGSEDTLYSAFSAAISAYSLNWLPYGLFGNSLISIPVTFILISLLFIGLFLASPAVFGLMLMLPAIIILIVDVLIEVIAYFLVKDKRIKIVALFLLMSGFLLDFFSS
jgi:hypothetical protein